MVEPDVRQDAVLDFDLRTLHIVTSTRGWPPVSTELISDSHNVIREVSFEQAV